MLWKIVVSSTIRTQDALRTLKFYLVHLAAKSASRANVVWAQRTIGAARKRSIDNTQNMVGSAEDQCHLTHCVREQADCSEGCPEGKETLFNVEFDQLNVVAHSVFCLALFQVRVPIRGTQQAASCII